MTACETVRFVDVRHEQGKAHRKSRLRGPSGARRTVRRDPSTIDTVVIHQMGVEFGVSGRQLRRSNGDRQLALARRSLRVPCHAASFDGLAVLSCPADYYIYQANSANRRSIGFEIDGCYQGVSGGKTWNGAVPTEWTQSRLWAARRALAELVAAARADGCPLRYIVAHRQVSRRRTTDPGFLIWGSVVLDYAVPSLGLETRPSWTLERGRPVPHEWELLPDGSIRAA